MSGQSKGLIEAAEARAPSRDCAPAGLTDRRIALAPVDLEFLEPRPCRVSVLGPADRLDRRLTIHDVVEATVNSHPQDGRVGMTTHTSHDDVGLTRHDQDTRLAQGRPEA